MYMKKNLFVFSSAALVLFCGSCNDNRYESKTTSTDSPAIVNTNSDTMTRSNTSPATNPPVTITPLSKEDSMFVVEASMGATMEVESGNLAQQNAMNQRVKDYGAMMVTDHGQGKQELMNLASAHGMSLPASLPANLQKHIDGMKKMTGKSFDQHYVGMMVTDHKEDLSKFKKAEAKVKSEDLKTWITNAIPVLQKHMDSIEAIKKMKM